MHSALEQKDFLERELRDEISNLKGRICLATMDSRRSDEEVAAIVGETGEHTLEARVIELEAQLSSAIEENRELQCRADELETKLEDAAQDVEELNEALLCSQRRCHLLEQTTLEAQSLLDDAKCESEAQQTRMQELRDLMEIRRQPPLTSEQPQMRLRTWLGQSRQSLLENISRRLTPLSIPEVAVVPPETGIDVDKDNLVSPSVSGSSSNASDSGDDDETKATRMRDVQENEHIGTVGEHIDISSSILPISSIHYAMEDCSQHPPATAHPPVLRGWLGQSGQKIMDGLVKRLSVTEPRVIAPDCADDIDNDNIASPSASSSSHASDSEDDCDRSDVAATSGSILQRSSVGTTEDAAAVKARLRLRGGRKGV